MCAGMKEQEYTLPSIVVTVYPHCAIALSTSPSCSSLALTVVCQVRGCIFHDKEPAEIQLAIQLAGVGISGPTVADSFSLPPGALETEKTPSSFTMPRQAAIVTSTFIMFTAVSLPGAQNDRTASNRGPCLVGTGRSNPMKRARELSMPGRPVCVRQSMRHTIAFLGGRS